MRRGHHDMPKRAATKVVAIIAVVLTITAPGASGAPSRTDALYITENLRGRVLSAAMSGGISAPLAGGLDGPRAIAVHGDALYIAVTNGLVTIPVSGGPSRPLGAADQPFGVAVAGDTLYVAEAGAGRVVALPLRW